MCKAQHTEKDFIELLSVEYSDGSSEVARWCKDCGIAVVDKEFDNRLVEKGNFYIPNRFYKKNKRRIK